MQGFAPIGQQDVGSKFGLRGMDSSESDEEE